MFDNGRIAYLVKRTLRGALGLAVKQRMPVIETACKNTMLPNVAVNF